MARRLPGGGRLTFGIVSLVAAACGTGSNAQPASTTEALGTPTYYADVAPIVNDHCAKCHYTGGIGPFPLTTFAETQAMAAAIVEDTASRAMPPWTAQDTTECTPPLPWRGDERLTLDEIDLLRRWAAGGAPAGDVPTSVPAALVTSDVSIDNPTFDLVTQNPYTPNATALQDDFHCFVMDAPASLAAGGWISAIDVVAGNSSIVHHASVWADPGGIYASNAGPDGSFDCPTSDIGAPGVDGSIPDLSVLLAWAPGAKPLEFPDGVAIQLPPSSKVVMQVHYSTGGRAVTPDSSHVKFMLSATKPEYEVSQWSVGNFGSQDPEGNGLLPDPDDRGAEAEFRIPARNAAHVETMQAQNLGDSLILFGVRAHAHLAANDIKVDLVHEQSPECLLEDKWDFHWQRTYSYDAPIEALPRIQPNDLIRVRCTYNDTMENLRLGDELLARGLQPADMYLGENTLDEMCMAELLFLQKTD